MTLLLVLTYQHLCEAICPNMSFDMVPVTSLCHVELRNHISTKHPQLSCDQCTFTSNSSFQLSVHMNSHSHLQPNPSESYSNTAIQCCTNRHQNNSLQLLLEEQIDMFQTLKSLQQSMAMSFNVPTIKMHNSRVSHFP